MQLKDVYSLAKKPVPFSEGPLKDSWFPEIFDIESRQYGPAGERWAREGRFVITEGICESVPAGVTAQSVYALWFDGQPVALIRAIDVDSSDDAQRWVTDPRGYRLLGAYLWLVLQEAEELPDVADPEQNVLPEALFQFQPVVDRSARPALKEFSVLPNYESYLVKVPSGHLLLSALMSVPEMPQYARRGKTVMRYVRPVSEQELADNQNLRDYTLGGYSKLAWYVSCPMPLDAMVTPV